jgi:hypothetical protein
MMELGLRMETGRVWDASNGAECLSVGAMLIHANKRVVSRQDRS